LLADYSIGIGASRKARERLYFLDQPNLDNLCELDFSMSYCRRPHPQVFVLGRTVQHAAEHNIVSYIGASLGGEGVRVQSLVLSKLTSSAEGMSMYELWELRGVTV
jgi:hypothetical protein